MGVCGLGFSTILVWETHAMLGGVFRVWGSGTRAMVSEFRARGVGLYGNLG